MGVGVSLAGLDIRSIDKYHETSAELSRSSGGDDVALHSHLLVRTPSPGITSPGVVKPKNLAPYMGFRLCLAGFDISAIDKHHETSAELSRSSGGDGFPLRSHLLVRTQSPPRGCETVKVSLAHGCQVIPCGFPYQIDR